MLQRLLARVGLPVLLGLKPMHRQHQQMQGHVQCEWAVLLLLFLTWRLLYAQWQWSLCSVLANWMLDV